MKTWKQYREDYFNSCRYGEKYRQDKKLFAYKCMELMGKWVEYLQVEAEKGPLPHWVITDFIRIYGEKELFRTFRGRHEKGISKYRIQ